MSHVPRIFIVLIAALAAYVGSYASLRWIRPELINTNDGPVWVFRTFYYPLRYIDADRPEYYSGTESGWLKVVVEDINYGTGYLVFGWGSGSYRVAFSNEAMVGLRVGDEVWVHLDYDLFTWDDFVSRMIPFVDRTRKEPNQAMQTTAIICPDCVLSLVHGRV